MTNASIKNLLFGLSVVAIAAALSMGVFAKTVSAADDGGWSDFGGSWSDFSSYNGGWGDYSSYSGGWDDTSYSGWSDFSSYGGGWNDYNSYDGWGDYSSYGGDWNDYSYYNPGYYEYDSYNPGYYEQVSYNPGYYEYDSYNPGYYEQVSYNPGYSEVYEEYFQDYQQQSFGQQQYQQAMSYMPQQYRPQTPSYPVFPQTPSYPAPVPPTPHYPQPLPPVHNTNTNINTCTGNSCNTNINNIDNSINGSFNTATLTYPQPQPIIQYQVPTYTQNQAPYCVITISQGYSQGMITLSWSSQYATSATISPSVGQVAPNGSTSLYAYGNSVYTLTVYGPGGSYICRTQSYVAPAAPVSPYVSLTQIPYTGLALGPIGNAIYWMSLLSLAVAGAYLLVYYKGGALALAGSMKFRSEEADVDAAEGTIVEAPVSSPVQLSNLPTQSSTRDAIRMTRDANGQPRLVISRS